MSSLTVPIPPDLSPACRAENTVPGTVPENHETLGVPFLSVVVFIIDGMTTTWVSTVNFTTDEKAALKALLNGGFRSEDADVAVSALAGAATLIARLQGVQVHAIGCVDRVRGGSRGAVAEVGLAASTTQNYARQMMTISRELTTRLPLMLELMDGGKLDWYCASKIVDATIPLSDEDAAVVDGKLVSRVVGKDPTAVRKAAAYAASKADPAGAAGRAARRRAGRRVTLTRQESGTASLAIDDAPVEKAVAVYRRIDRAARALKTRDEPRTLDQLRTDVALDLLMGHVHGGGMRTEVFLYMDVNTYIGLNSDPAEMAGHGTIPAELAQYLATGPDTVLRRIITDPVTGQAIELGRTRYRPTAEVEEFVKVRDRECRGIGCSRPAQSCDTDHHVDWAHGGPTNAKELITYCKFEHKLKDEPGWHRDLDEDGTLTVTTPTGRSYPSKPEPLHEPRPLPENDHDNTEPPF